ncbi:MAG: baseplate J/gp47 family protein [Anaerolineales bacterium]|nr:baseplate J/gp47 family protein [Anaerolineales bacterium]
MKTKIITLESHDDLISVRDKLSWAKTPRILLVWPKYEKVVLRILDLKILQRHADSLGAQLGLVTRRLNVRRDAEALGIPVFKTLTAAQKGFWGEAAPRERRVPPPPKADLRQMRDEARVKEAAWRTSLLGRLIAFSVGVAAVLILASLFVPRAVITIQPETRDVALEIPVNASPSFSSVSLSGEIPAQTLSVELSGEKTLQASSLVTTPKTKAQGAAQFTNLSADEILIPAGTVVATDALIRFATLYAARLPAGANKTVEVKIAALDAGPQANVEAGAIRVIEGALGLSATATNVEATSGGANVEARGASEEERAALRDSVLADLKEKAKAEARKQIGANDWLIDDALAIENIQSEKFSPPDGEASPTLTYAADVEFSARYVAETDLKTLALSSLTASVPPDFSASGEMTLAPKSAPFTDSTGVTRFALVAKQPVRRNADAAQILNLARGRDPQTAAALIQKALSLQSAPQISLAPSWWKWLPLIPFNISVVVH